MKDEQPQDVGVKPPWCISLYDSIPLLYIYAIPTLRRTYLILNKPITQLWSWAMGVYPLSPELPIAGNMDK